MARMLQVLACFSLCVIVITGCGTRLIYPVRGQIVDKSGNAVTGLKGATIEFDSLDHKASATGVIDDKGEFKLSTNGPNDGAHIGKHRIIIMRRDLGADVESPHVILPRFEKFETSGLTATVERKDNLIKLEVELNK